MRGFPLAILWCCATALSAAATPVAVAAGPWSILREDGGVSIAIEIAPAMGAERAAAFTLWRAGAALAGAPTAQELERPRQSVTTVLSWRIGGDAWRPGGFAIHDGDRCLALGALSAPPRPDEAARVAIAGAADWPSAEQLARLGERLGGAPQVVIALGGALERDLGRGGWEAFTPIVAVGADTRGPTATLLAGAAGERRRGLGWGVLGLPTARGAAADGLDLARDLSPWQACLDADAAWDLSLSADAARAIAAPLAPLLAIAGRLRLPVIVAAGRGGGFVSEPLRADGDGRVVVADDGTRYVLATAGGEGLAALPAEAAVPIDGRAIVGIAADAREMRLIVEPDAGTRERHALHWRIGDDGRRAETVVGADAERIAARARGGDGDALAILSWLPAPTLAAYAPTPVEVKAALAAGGDAASARLLRRLAQRDATFLNGDASRPLKDLPVWLARDLALRQIAAGGPLDGGAMGELAVTTRDAATLRALVVAQRRARDPGDALGPILARLRRQAEGALPVDDDPLLQHALASSAFDAPALSPTTLRPLALALRAKLDAGARGPIERFLARHGEERPADR